MILHKALVDTIEHGGKTYKLNPSFDAVLDALESLASDLTDEDKLEYSLWRLVKGRHPQSPELLSAILGLLLSDESTKDSGGEKSLDIEQDAEYIYAGFLQAYGIDLDKARGQLHWWSFCALLKSLPKETRIAEIMEIRVRPMPKPTKYNAEERRELARLKNAYRLKVNQAERDRNYQNALIKLARTLGVEIETG